MGCFKELSDKSDQLRYKAKQERLGLEQERGAGALPKPPFPRTFFKQQQPDNEIDSKFRLFSDELLHILNCYRRKKFSSNLSQQQKLGFRQIRELIKSKSIRLSVSDKGGEFVVIPRQLDIEITERHLQDVTLYRSSSVKEFKEQCCNLNKGWVKTARAADLQLSLIRQLESDTPICPVLYTLIKTHKLSSFDDFRSNDPSTFKVRPIISCVGGPTDKINGFLASYYHSC